MSRHRCNVIAYLVALLLPLLIGGCATPSGRQQRTVVVTAAEMGEAWPFRVPRGEVYCEAYRAAIFRAGNVSYALNDRAIEEGYADITPILLPGHDPRPVLPVALVLCE